MINYQQKNINIFLKKKRKKIFYVALNVKKIKFYK